MIRNISVTQLSKKCRCHIQCASSDGPHSKHVMKSIRIWPRSFPGIPPRTVLHTGAPVQFLIQEPGIDLSLEEQVIA